MADKLLAVNEAASKLLVARQALAVCFEKERKAREETFAASLAVIHAEDDFNRKDAEYLK